MSKKRQVLHIQMEVISNGKVYIWVTRYVNEKDVTKMYPRVNQSSLARLARHIKKNDYTVKISNLGGWVAVSE